MDHDVYLTVDIKAGSMKLEGCANDVKELHLEIHQYLHDYEKKKQEYEKAVAISSYVQWSYEIHGKKTKFSPNVNLIIENSYKNGEKTCKISDRSGKEYVVDFKSLKEHEVNNPSVQVSVERRDATVKTDTSVRLPSSWDVMSNKDSLKWFELKPGNKEYDDIHKRFIDTANPSQKYPTVVKVTDTL